jgi:hypothetical protein
MAHGTSRTETHTPERRDTELASATHEQNDTIDVDTPRLRFYGGASCTALKGVGVSQIVERSRCSK